MVYFASIGKVYALASVTQLVGTLSCNRKVVGSIPGLGVYGRQPMDVSLSLSLPLPLSLKAMKKHPLVRIKKERKIYSDYASAMFFYVFSIIAPCLEWSSHFEGNLNWKFSFIVFKVCWTSLDTC